MPTKNIVFKRVTSFDTPAQWNTAAQPNAGAGKLAVRGFVYSGKDARGKPIKRARVPFQSIEEARVKLAAAGIKVEKIAPISETFAFLDYKKNSKPTVLDMASLADQIAAQYTTGLSYDKICRILGRVHPKTQVREVLNNVDNLIGSGRPAHEAFASQLDKKGRPFFPATFIYAFKIGDHIGALPDPETGISSDAPVMMLKFFSRAQRKAAAISKSIFSGLIGPVAILLTSLIVFFIQVYFIVPQFALIFAGLLQGKDTSLPASTQLMLDISDFLYSYGGIAFMIALFGSLAVAVYYFWFTEKGIDKRGRLVLEIPLLNKIFLPFNGSVFCRNLSMLWAAESDITRRYGTVGETTVNPAFRELAEHCQEQALQTAPPVNELFNGHLHLLGESFAPVAETIEANPGRGQELLYTYAKFLEDEAEENLAIAIATFNKFVYILSAVIVAFILVASYSPMIEMIGRMASR